MQKYIEIILQLIKKRILKLDKQIIDQILRIIEKKIYKISRTPLYIILLYIIGILLFNLSGRKFKQLKPEIVDEFSIGIYEGSSPFHLKPSTKVRNPIISAINVEDASVGYVADPFMIYKGHKWQIFFEIFNNDKMKGEIAFAESIDAITWEYKGIVLKENFHLSYPYVFHWNEEIYMIPESKQNSEVRLYKAINYPLHWVYVKCLITGKYVDSSILRYESRWWLFSCTEDNTLRLFWADDLMGKWHEHPKSPIVRNDSRAARPAGRILQNKENLIRFSQDSRRFYGEQIFAFNITELTTSNYVENLYSNNSILSGTGFGWNQRCMHHIDAYQNGHDSWLACVDGGRRRIIFDR